MHDFGLVIGGISNWWSYVFSSQTLWIMLWIGLAVLTVTLMVLTRTRWGQAKPLSKCVALSVFAHMLFMGYAYGTRLIFETPPAGDRDVIRLTIVEGESQTTHAAESGENDGNAWDKFDDSSFEKPDLTTPDRQLAALTDQSSEQRTIDIPTMSREPLTDRLPQNDDARPFVPANTSDEKLRTTRPGESAADIEHVDVQQREDQSTPTGPAITGPQRIQPEQRDAVISRSTISDNAASQLIPEESRLQRMVDAAAGATKADALLSQQDVLRQASDQPNTQTPHVPSPLANVVIEGADAPSASASNVSNETRPGTSSPPRRMGDGQQLPTIYELRVTDDLARIAAQQGGDESTEAAVRAALKWLADHQSEDGRWNARRYGAGNETKVLGHDRQSAGGNADTGITGLAVLAFLAHDQSHLKGEYREHVQHGLEFLIRTQASDGNLAGKAELYAMMYCHGMATLAISEAYAITGDNRLKPYVQRAVDYTVASQNQTSGGWRYRPSDVGDTSQFGWQVMALKSAEMAGITIPARTKTNMQRFLQSVSSGQHGGLASYRAGEKVSRPMTAEALTCRFFMNSANSPELIDEATSYIAQEPPGNEKANLYYWYYATLAMYHASNDHWPAWNEALKRRLVELQENHGDNAGSWSPDTVWGGYGGRVYTTAMATLSLEVYYRYLPIMKSQDRTE